MKTITFWLLDLWNKMLPEEDGLVPVMHLWGILPNGRRILIVDSHCRPHHILETPNGKVNIKAIKRVKRMLGGATRPPIKIEKVEKLYWGELRDFIEVTGTNPSVDIKEYERMAVKKGWISHESDIYYDQVYMKARGIRPCAWNTIKGDITRGSVHYGGKNIFTIEKFSKNEVDTLTDAPKLKESGFDIEGGHDIIKELPILTIYYWANGKMYKLQNKRKNERGEEKMLNAFVSAFKKTRPDLIYQYNGNSYDWLQIIEAVDDLGMELPFGVDGSNPSVTQYNSIMVKGRPTVDLFGFASRVGSKRKTLYAVHEELLKDGHVPKRKYYPVNRNKIYELPWKEVDKHCIMDVICCMDIGRHSLPFHMYLSQSTGLPIDQAGIVSMNPNVESLLMRFAHARGELIPNKGEKPHTVGSLQGAQTYEPTDWFAEKVVVLDFSSQYPWIMSKNNIDYASYTENPQLPLSQYHMIANTDADVNYFFRKEPRGLVAETTHYVIESIEEAKKRFGTSYSAKYAGEVQAMKTIGRSLYGYMKYKFGRWGSVNCARAITAQARNEVRGAADYVNTYYPDQLEVIYGDTDSIFVRCIDESFFDKGIMTTVAEDVSEAVGAQLALDTLYKRIFFCELTGGGGLAKKKYIYLDVNDKVDMAGFAGKRGDWSPIATKVQWKIANKLMRTEDIEKGVKSCIRYTNNVLRNIRGVPLKDFAFTIRVRGDPEEWDNILPHRAVAMRNPEFIEEDGRVQYIICNEDAGRSIHGSRYRNIQSHRALHPSELDSKSDIDYAYYRESQIGTLANRVLEQFIYEYNIDDDIDTDVPDVDYYEL